MIKLTKVFWILSLLGFIAVLLLTYAYLPSQVIISEDARGIAELIIEKEHYFYYVMALIIGFNGFLLLFGEIVLGLPASFLPIPKRKIWGRNSITRKELRVRFKNWIKGFGLAFNCFGMLTLGTIFDVNDKDYYFQYGFISYVVVAFLVAWVIFYFPLFNATERIEEEIRVS